MDDTNIAQQIVESLIDKSQNEEAAVVASLVYGGDVSQAIPIIRPTDFSNDNLKLIYETIIEIYSKQAPINIKTVISALDGHYAFEDDTDIKNHIRMNRSAGLPEWTKPNALALKQRSTRLKAARVAYGILDGLGASEKEMSSMKIIMDAKNELDEVKLETGLKKRSSADVVRQMVAEWESPTPVVKTGLPSYDKLLGGGFVAGKTYCLAGSSKAGKTMAAGTLSYNLGRRGVRHAYICLEMGAIEIEQRQVCIHHDIPTKWFMDDKLKRSPELLDYLHSYQVFLGEESSREFIDESLIRTSDIIAELYRLKMEGFEGVIIDYFGLIHPDIGFKGSQNDHQDALGALITSTAKALGIWVLAIAQLNNNGDTYGSKALMRACTHVVALERCNEDDVNCAVGEERNQRWLRTISSRYTRSFDVGSENEPGFMISKNGSHVIDLIQGRWND